MSDGMYYFKVNGEVSHAERFGIFGLTWDNDRYQVGFMALSEEDANHMVRELREDVPKSLQPRFDEIMGNFELVEFIPNSEIRSAF